MRRRLLPLISLPLALGAAAAMAEPATPDGAKAMANAYAAYFSPAVLENGILAIATQGDDYVVTWDLGKALEESKPEAQQIKISPFVYRVTPTLDGGWLARADALPKISIGPTKPDSGDGGEIAFDGFRFEGLYDPEAADFFRSKLALGALKVDVLWANFGFGEANRGVHRAVHARRFLILRLLHVLRDDHRGDRARGLGNAHCPVYHVARLGRVHDRHQVLAGHVLVKRV